MSKSSDSPNPALDMPSQPHLDAQALAETQLESPLHVATHSAGCTDPDFTQMDSESEADIRRVLRSSLGAVEETAQERPRYVAGLRRANSVS